MPAYTILSADSPGSDVALAFGCLLLAACLLSFLLAFLQVENRREYSSAPLALMLLSPMVANGYRSMLKGTCPLTAEQIAMFCFALFITMNFKNAGSRVLALHSEHVE